MKYFILLVVFFLSMNSFSQTTEEKDVKKTIETFFDGFHKQDSILIKQTIADEVIMQTIGKNREGDTFLKNEDFTQFLKTIVSIPKDQKFEEKLLSFNIQIDGAMAHAWTPYEFWFNGQFSHCGVNSFQLVKIEDIWKIVYLIDTRRKEVCGQ